MIDPLLQNSLNVNFFQVPENRIMWGPGVIYMWLFKKKIHFQILIHHIVHSKFEECGYSYL